MYATACYGAIELGGDGTEIQEDRSACVELMSRAGARDIGDLWVLDLQVRDEETDALVDPLVVTLQVEPPFGAPIPMALTRLGPGSYVAQVSLTAAQVWRAYAIVAGGYEGSALLDVVVLPDP
jgi:hypothetical protein